MIKLVETFVLGACLSLVGFAAAGESVSANVGNNDNETKGASIFLSNGAEIDSSCVGNNHQDRKVLKAWELIFRLTFNQILACSKHYNIPSLNRSIEFLMRSRVHCVSPGDRLLINDLPLVSDPFFDASAPFSIPGDERNPLGLRDWEKSRSNFRVILVNENLLDTVGGSYLPATFSGWRGPLQASSDLFHESLHYLTRYSHDSTPDGAADPINTIEWKCFPSGGFVYLGWGEDIALETMLSEEYGIGGRDEVNEDIFRSDFNPFDGIKKHFDDQFNYLFDREDEAIR